jgi:hypothetical protein
VLIALLGLGCGSSSPRTNAANAAGIAGQALVTGAAAVAGAAVEGGSHGGDDCPRGCPGELECINKHCQLLPARKHPKERPAEYEVPPDPPSTSPE